MNTEDLKLIIEELEVISLEMQNKQEWTWLTKISKIKAILTQSLDDLNGRN